MPTTEILPVFDVRVGMAGLCRLKARMYYFPFLVLTQIGVAGVY